MTPVVEPYVPEPGVLALRIRKARAGLAPLPLGNIVAHVAKAVRAADLDAVGGSGGDPVLQIGLRTLHGTHGKLVPKENWQLRQGEALHRGNDGEAEGTS